MDTIEEETQRIVTELVDSWNVGIKSGYLETYMCRDREAVKQHMRSVGITVYLRYVEDSMKFIMVKTPEDAIPNPLSKYC